MIVVETNKEKLQTIFLRTEEGAMYQLKASSFVQKKEWVTTLRSFIFPSYINNVTLVSGGTWQTKPPSAVRIISPEGVANDVMKGKSVVGAVQMDDLQPSEIFSRAAKLFNHNPYDVMMTQLRSTMFFFFS
jgi:hypothetical protein